MLENLGQLGARGRGSRKRQGVRQALAAQAGLGQPQSWWATALTNNQDTGESRLTVWDKLRLFFRIYLV